MTMAEKLAEAGISTYQEVEKLLESIDNALFLSTSDKQCIQAYVEERRRKNAVFHTAFDEKRFTQSIWKDIATGCQGVDSVIGGGLKCGTVTEVCGRGATGKTQMCMLLCATVQRYNTLYSQSKAMYFPFG